MNDKTVGEGIAERLTKERGAVYGEPIYNLECAHRLKEIYRYYCTTFRPTTRKLAPNDPRGSEGWAAHDEAIEAILGKIARIATGRFHQDNYDDIHGYCKIANDLTPRN